MAFWFLKKANFSRLFVVSSSLGTDSPTYNYVKLSDGISYLPAWLSHDGAKLFISEKQIAGAQIVELTMDKYLDGLRWHERSGIKLFLQVNP